MRIDSKLKGIQGGGMSEDLRYPVAENGRFGFIDRYGNEVVPCQFDGVSGKGYSCGVCSVVANGKWGFINHEGEWTVPPKFYFLGSYCSDTDLAPFQANKGSKFGFVGRDGDVKVEERFDYAYPYDGLFSRIVEKDAKSNKLMGLIDEFGRPLIPCVWQKLSNCEFGMFCACKPGDKAGFIDFSGEFVIQPIYDQGVGFYGDRWATMSRNGRTVYINKDGVEVLSCDTISNPFFCDRSCFEDHKGKYGFMDRSGAVVIESISTSTSKFSEGVAACHCVSSGLWGYIDLVGTWVVEPQFLIANSFRGPLALVNDTNGGKGYINICGEWVWRAARWGR